MDMEIVIWKIMRDNVHALKDGLKIQVNEISISRKNHARVILLCFLQIQNFLKKFSNYGKFCLQYFQFHEIFVII